MELLNKFILYFIVIITFAGCGVKGVPLPPLTPAPIGRGEPTYSEATKTKEKKKSTKYQDLEETPIESQESQ
ncbi:MAG TPA: hypothetical protein VN132_14670 [Bdellovibrio sp.]|nr:hypothetical protein [Bdellovibrio sp.]